MTATWDTELSSSLAQESVQGGEEQSNLWESLKKHVDINEYQPCPNPNVVVQEIKDGTENYFVLKNAKRKTYLRLSPEEYNLWRLMDRERTVKDLIVENFVTTGVFSHNKVTLLVNQLITNHLLAEEPILVWAAVNTQVRRRSWAHKIAMPAQLLLAQHLNIAGIDHIITFIHKTIGWLFFTRPVQVALAGIALVGFVIFNLIVSNPNYVLVSQIKPSELALFWLAAVLPIFIHELGHGLTVKHYGREINAGGLMLYFGLPAAYVDTTDIWLENRRARLNVTWNGPYTGLVIGGICAIFMWLYPANGVNSFLFKMATVAYLTILINVNPLLKYDGYYLLSDALKISFLRERSLNFLQKGLLGKLARREKLTRDEKIFTVFGALSIIWTAYALYLAVAFWQTRLNTSLQVFLGSNYSLFTKGLEFLSTGAFISLLALILLQFIRLILNLVTRFVRAGGLQRHWQFAAIIMTFSFLVAFGTSNLVDIYRGWIVIFVVSGFSLATLGVFLAFNQSYYFSNRWLAQFFLALALLSLALIPVAEELMPTGSAHSEYLLLASNAFATLAGFLFIFPAIKQVKPLQVFLGMLAGIFLGVLGYFLHLFSWNLAFLPLFPLIAIVNWFSLRRGGRFPALALIYIGIMFTAVAFSITRYIPRYWSFGILISCSGYWHLILARLPKLSKFEPIFSTRKVDAIGYSVAILVKRVIAQVFFESGWGGIESFGRSFNEHNKGLGINLSISGNQFNDQELAQRTTFDLTEVYGVAFDKIYNLMKERFGDQFARHIISLGVDLIPWQYREVTGELVLARRDWGLELNQERGDQRSRRIKLLDRVSLFVNATYDDLRAIAVTLTPHQYAAREVIIRQGDAGSEFFIIESGKVQIWVQEGDHAPQLVNSLGVGQYFGEVALVTDNPRNATVIAETPTVLLSLGREDFDTLVKHHLEFAKKIKSDLRNKWVLRNMPIFDELDAIDLMFIASKLQTETYKVGETIIRQGDMGEKFYIIESGEVAVYYQTPEGTVIELDHHTVGDYFGETALIQNSPRTASIRAVVDTTLFSLGRHEFLDMLGDFQNMQQAFQKTSTRRQKSTA